MVAASKMRKAQESALATRAYADSGQQIMARLRAYLATEGADIQHPLLVKRPVETIVLVVIASDRGLAGGYNANVIKQTLEFLQEHKDKQIRLVTVGRKAQEAFNRLGIELTASFTDFAAKPTSQDIMPIAKLTTAAFLSGECDQVSVIYTKFYSTLRQIAEAKQILPIDLTREKVLDESKTQVDPYIFEPEPNIVLDFIIPRLVEMQLLQTLLDAIASEHSSRMLAMKNATDNAIELIGDLQLTYNSVRQANITREIAEISAGANAI